MNALEPCPFCGGTDITLSAWDVQCGGCGALVLPEKGSYHEVGAIAAWNRRAATTGRETREALQPFADIAEKIAAEHPGWYHDKFEILTVGGFSLSLAPFIAAARALASNGDGDE